MLLQSTWCLIWCHTRIFSDRGRGADIVGQQLLHVRHPVWLAHAGGKEGSCPTLNGHHRKIAQKIQTFSGLILKFQRAKLILWLKPTLWDEPFGCSLWDLELSTSSALIEEAWKNPHYGMNPLAAPSVTLSFQHQVLWLKRHEKSTQRE